MISADVIGWHDREAGQGRQLLCCSIHYARVEGRALRCTAGGGIHSPDQQHKYHCCCNVRVQPLLLTHSPQPQETFLSKALECHQRQVSYRRILYFIIYKSMWVWDSRYYDVKCKHPEILLILQNILHCSLSLFSQELKFFGDFSCHSEIHPQGWSVSVSQMNRKLWW